MLTYNKINYIQRKAVSTKNSLISNYFVIFYYCVCLGDYLLILYPGCGNTLPWCVALSYYAPSQPYTS